MINRIMTHLTDPAVWGVITASFSAPDDQVTLRLYQKNPAARQTMLMEELSEKLAQNPALVAQFDAILADDTPSQTWHIEGENVGIVNANNANFQGAQNFNITGLQIQAPSPQPSPLPPNGGEGRGSHPSPPGRGAGVRDIKARLATMSDDEIIIFCYDKAHHLYAKLPHNRATLRRELLAYLESK